MNDLFNPESKFIRFLTRLTDCIILNILLVVMSATIVLAGDAQAALYTVTLKMVRREEGEITKNYFRALKKNFLPSAPATPLLLIDIFMMAVIYYSLRADTLVFSPMLYVLLWILIALLTAFLSYLFPLISRFDNKFGEHCRNALGLSLANLPVTIMVTIINLAPFITTAFLQNMAGYVAGYWLFIGVGLGAYINSYYLRTIFDKKTITGGGYGQD